MLLTNQRIVRLSYRISRLLVLFAVLFATFVLWSWNRNNDPRFYYFLSTRPGKIIGSLTGWTENSGQYIKPDQELSQIERGYKRSLEKVIKRAWPEHVMTLKDGSRILGRVTGETDSSIRFKPMYGEMRLAELDVPQALIVHVEANAEVQRPVSYRDIEFKMEYPDLGFCRLGPYTILTDADFVTARNLIRKLDRLDDDVRGEFKQLMRPVAATVDIQIVYVVEKKRFLANREGHDHQHVADASGLYIPDKERLIIYDQVGGTGKSRLPELEFVQTVQSEAVSTNAVYRPNMQAFIDETHQTLRHEGAHHLFFRYGIHSDFRAENPWLIEGLACYFESDVPGDLVSTYVNILRAGEEYGQFIPLDQLVNYRSRDGIMDVHPEGRFDMSYAESWSLVRMLMQPEYQNGFFDYIRFVRNPDKLDELTRRERLHVLAEKVGLSVSELRTRWKAYQLQMINS